MARKSDVFVRAASVRHPHGGNYTEIARLPHLREAFAAELFASCVSG
ncbi:hypothetical protein ACL02S_10700 [Nocardia sp. 004]